MSGQERGGSVRKYCLWGWRPGYIQIGSEFDRAVQRMHLDFAALRKAVGRALLPHLRALVDNLASVAADLRRPPK
jgi:hypothetical protein